MKTLTALFAAIVIVVMGVSPLSGQEAAAGTYENAFFTLDFEQDEVDLAEVEEFFFTTFPHNDPTMGDVVYDRVKWTNDEMIALTDSGLYGYVKYRGDELSFDSFRFTSKPFYNLKDDTQKVLFVFKGSFPSAKGVWPAWWLNGSRQDEWLYTGQQSVFDEMLDPYSSKGEFHNSPSPVNCTDWPSAGEIDIIETINGDNIIHNTIHTCPQMCDSEWNNDGIIINCANGIESDPNKGCSGVPYSVDAPEGTFACIWEAKSLSFYYWEPGSDVRSPGGPLSDTPDPDSWNSSNRKNRVQFLETDAECDKAVHFDWQCRTCEGKDECTFVNLKMVFNITICGKWAGAKFDDTENANENCSEYIVNDGLEAIDGQYIKIEYVSVSSID